MLKDDKDLCLMVKEMLDTTDKGFTDWEIQFLDLMHKRKKFTFEQSNKICEIYVNKM